MLYCKHISISEKESEILCTLRLSKINKLLIHLLLILLQLQIVSIKNIFILVMFFFNTFLIILPSFPMSKRRDCCNIFHQFKRTNKNQLKIIEKRLDNSNIPIFIAINLCIFEFKTCTFASLSIYTTEKWELSSCNCKLFNCVNNMIYITAFHNEWIN